MLTVNSVSRCLGLVLIASTATVSCDDDNDGDGGTGGASNQAGTPASGGHSGTQATGGAGNNAGAPEPGGGAGASAGGAEPTSVEVVRTDLISDEMGAGGAGGAGGASGDPNLINAWGISFDPDPEEDTHFWVSAADSGVSTVYAPDGTPAPLVVTIPAAAAGETGSPTGQVYNPTTDFEGDKFIFASEDGLITGWQAGTVAVVRADLSADAASFKGLTLVDGTDPILIAANFYAGKLDVFDAAYAAVDTPMFVDPKPVSGYAPFNVAALGDKVYVAYAKQNADKDEEVAGAGLGYVDAFEPDGSFVTRLLAAGGALNAPWGLALAPAGFAPAPGALVVGNFGDGMIHAYDPETGQLTQEFADSAAKPLAIDGLWALAFGPKKDAEDLSENLYFTAGPEEETHGVFGVLTAP